MSTVYRAFDETLERWVAIKLMHTALSDDPLQHERFRREARAVARLSHPHIVTVIDAGDDDGHPYIVLEYVEGETLKARLRRGGGLPVVEAVAYKAESQVGVAMKHVRERIPDVQHVWPEVSAALAAVIERATAKERRNRYATAEEMVWDLEQALAIEAARRVEATGEATTVLRALPEETGRLAPGRLRRPGRYVGAALLVAAAVAGAILLLATNTERGSRLARATPPPGLHIAHLVGATDYDPFGGDGEHPEQTQNAIDRVALSTWSTSHYSSGNLGKPGVGIYVDARTRVHGRRLDI